MRLPVVMVCAGMLACSRGAPPGAGPAESGAAATTPGGGSAEGGAPSPSADLSAKIPVAMPVNSTLAQTLGMRYAAQHWPQYHAKAGVALRNAQGWNVFIQFEEVGVGAHVTLDMNGAVLDAGTSNGEH